MIEAVEVLNEREVKVELKSEQKARNHWKLIKLGKILDLVGGGTPDKKNSAFWNGRIPWASVKDIKGKYLTKTQDSITQQGLDYSSTRLAKPGELILITRISPGKASISKIEVAINQDLKIVKPKEEVDPLYLLYLFESLEKEIIKKSSGTTVLGIRLESLKEIEVLLPPLSEQREIVAKIEELLSELDQGKHQLVTARQQLKVYRRAVLKWAFEGKLTNARVSEQKTQDGGLPEGWKWTKRGDVAKKITDGEHATPKRTSEGILLLSARNVQNGYLELNNVDYISEEEYQRIIKRCNLEQGDILISCSGSIGRVSRVPANLKFTLVRSVALIKLNSEKHSSKFFEYLFQSPHLQKQIEKGKKATAQANLFLGPIKNLDVIECALEEQNQIVQEIESRLSVCDKVEETITQSLQQAETLRQSILKQAFEEKLVKAGKTVGEMA